ncbi:trypsin-like serine peptidase [Arthrobacter sp. NPDC058130]|uniref:trypsin-like serine peptidase n=1 Tax=Arthrobacter sp. NPDC058130 TaxID=3346353 RepID=UPI0036EDFDBF
MRTPKTLATSLLTLSAAALLALSAAGAATASPAPAKAPLSTSDVTGHTVTESGAADYWTADRMRNAVPGDVLADKAMNRRMSAKPAAAPLEGAAPSTVEATAPKKQSQAALAQTPQTKANASETPVPHIGKVFFTLGGTNYVCSGNSVSSGNKSTVSTAGHCVNEGPGAFATKFTFVPAYLNGASPYGKWTAKALYAPTQWSSSGDMTYDTGFAVMSTLNGQYLSDVVGASGLQFNAARGLGYKSFGYPAAAPFNGESLKSCSGAATNDPYNPQFNTQGIPCNMTGGSSGGPWFIGSSASGYQNSINSYGYGSNSTKMYGPYWGSVIQQAYTTAAAS